MKILFIGDIVGRPGRRAVRELLPALKQELKPDIVLANAENAAAGFGLTADTYAELLESGIEYMTLGNHTWDKPEIIPILATKTAKLLRPANFPAADPGRGYADILVGKERLRLINLIGQVFMGKRSESPFLAIDTILADPNRPTATLIDFHGEATSEKIAFSYYVDGRASAVIGTHTHVQTNDARILEQGTAVLTDCGMTGPRDGVLGLEREIIVRSYLTSQPWKGEVATGPIILSAVLVEIDTESGHATNIELIKREMSS